MSLLLWSALWTQEIAAGSARDGDWMRDLEARYERISRQAAGSVVAVRVQRKKVNRKSGGGLFSWPLDGGVFRRRPQDAPVTGVVVDRDGSILTTYENVSGAVESIEVVLPDGRAVAAQVKGFDAVADLALLEAPEAAGLEPIRAAPAPAPAVGTSVVAVGIAPGGGGLTLNPGIVSALDRVKGWGIQHDARLNFGNVGGPLLDLEGRLVGLTTHVSIGDDAKSPGQNSGVGMAVLWPRVGESLPHLKAGGAKKNPWLGIRGSSENQDGVHIVNVIEGEPAEKAGLKAGDVIVELDGVKLATIQELRDLIERRRVGDEVRLTVRRGDEEVELKAFLAEMRKGTE
jgi:S1-C subfamily serine protease